MVSKEKVSIQLAPGIERVLIQNDGKQDVFQQLQGWIQFSATRIAPCVLDQNPLDGGYVEQL